ncbi:hypothetical protein [Mycolicibacterium sp.]|uniref:hypothetical protein n=1 Tax=Mycolicibacterium sp. TaxID=2320850 RepID=UPI00355DE5D9
MTGLAAAVAAYNRAARELDIARRLLHSEQDAEAARGRGPAVCGKPSGYRAHLRDREPPCPACQLAESRRVGRYRRSER